MPAELTQFPPLALDRKDSQFLPEVDAVGWLIKSMTGGRPCLVKRGGDPVVLDLYASIEDLEEAVRFEVGQYRLYQVDANGKEVAGRVAYIEIRPENVGAAPLTHIDRVFDLAERLAQANEHKDLLIAEITSKLVASQVELQQGSAALLGAANETIKVANGVDALERQPHVDVDALGEQLSTALGLDDDDTESPNPTPWFVQLLSGPVGVGLMQFANNFMKAMAETQARQARQAKPQETG